MSLEDAQQGTIHTYRHRANRLELLAHGAKGEYEEILTKTVEHYRDLADALERAAQQLDVVTGRCSCGAPEPCIAPRFGGRHVPRDRWDH